MQRSAFTLVELMVAIFLMLILGSLALMILPALNQGQQTPRAATQLQQWIEIAKQEAGRTNSPRGIRLIPGQPPNNPMYITQLQYIELPDPYTLHGIDVSTAVAKTKLSTATQPVTGGGLQINFVNNTASLMGGFADPTLWPVQSGDYLELGGNIYRIQTVKSPSALTLLSPAPPISTSNYRILRQPRPAGDDPLEMPQNIVIDLTPRGISGGRWDLPPPMPNAPFDLLFAPDGRLIPAIGSSNLSAYDKIILWVRDTTVPGAAGDTSAERDPTLVVVYPRTGMIASQPVDTEFMTSSPYTFTSTGQRSSD